MYVYLYCKTLKGYFRNMTIAKNKMYWIAQASGWLAYFCIIVFYNSVGSGIDEVVLKSGFTLMAVGFLLTHLLRAVIIRFNWFNKGVLANILRILLSSTILGMIFHYAHHIISSLWLYNMQEVFNITWGFSLQMIVNWSFLIFFWAVLYYTAHYFLTYKEQLIKGLQLEASNKEIELTNLKSQLNPHFMFNALNSIRALVGENPDQAKRSITQLSIMLRATLNLNKQRLISLEEEMALVKAYLSLEEIRYEDRLSIEINIPSELLKLQVPVLLLQTIVENGIKHGISKLPNGGKLKISAELNKNFARIQVFNDGVLAPDKSDKGIGINNSKKRLELHFGTQAKLILQNKLGGVLTSIIIPK